MHIPAQYSAADSHGKDENKERLRDRFWLRKSWSPIVAFVGRLDEQKGMQMVHQALSYAPPGERSSCCLGSRCTRTGSAVIPPPQAPSERQPGCHLEISYSEELAHLVYARADMLVVPSLYEPCGPAPMVAPRYGTVPVVRSVGGMVDTAFDRDYSRRPHEERNGHAFQQTDNTAIESALKRALRLWFDYPPWVRRLMIASMQSDNSWNEPGREYLSGYREIRVA
jgi:starch synthase